MDGLKPKHHGELNREYENRHSRRYDELRQEYAGDKRAQRQIDIYDPNSAYQPRIREYRDALLSQDIEGQHRLEKWFREHGYEDL